MRGKKKIFIKTCLPDIHSIQEEKENDIADIKKKFKTKQRTLFGQETIGKHFDGWFELCRAIKSLAEWDAEVKGDELAISMWQRTTFFDYYELYLEVHR
jgi:hypothetical protein